MKLWIAGIGTCFPDTSLSNEFLCSVSGADLTVFAEKGGVESRRTTLSPEYIKETANKDPREARQTSALTATDLAADAAQNALQSAGVSATALELIVADSCTPIEVIPSEAQRIGSRLQTRIPAYDITAGTSAFAVFLSRILMLREDKLPGCILWVSTCAATQSVSYNDPVTAARFGDGAVAVVLSTSKGKLLVQGANCASESWCYRDATFPINRHIKSDDSMVSEGHAAMKGLFEKLTVDRYFGSYYAGGSASLPISTINKEYGDCLGVSTVAALEQEWQDLQSGETLGLLFAGAGSGTGTVTLQVE